MCNDACCRRCRVPLVRWSPLQQWASCHWKISHPFYIVLSSSLNINWLPKFFLRFFFVDKCGNYTKVILKRILGIFSLQMAHNASPPVVYGTTAVHCDGPEIPTQRKSESISYNRQTNGPTFQLTGVGR